MSMHASRDSGIGGDVQDIHVIATAGTDEKCEACLALGATLAINYRKQDYVSAIREHCGGGVDVVLDMVGGDYLQRNLSVSPDLSQ